MNKFLLLGSSALLGLHSVTLASEEASVQIISEERAAEESLPFSEYFQYETFTLENGLRVIVHEDRSAPAISVTNIINVGSKDEPEGKSGFAHLFEHLLFNGTVNAPGEYFEHLKRLGATGANGTTNNDRTNYFQTVPTGSLEGILWLESDRMANLLSGLSEEVLKNQIEVVKNEKGLSDNRPFGSSQYTLLEMLYPEGHPYAHSTIGSIEDLESATLDDVRQWFRDYYGARNMVLVLSGDVDRQTAEPLVRKYFSRLQPGPGIDRVVTYPVRRETNTLQHVTDIAPQSELKRYYMLPKITDQDTYTPTTAANLLGFDENSFLHRRLVEDMELATRAYGSVDARALDTVFIITLVPREGVSLERLSAALDEVMAEYREAGPTEADRERLAARRRNNVFRAAESIGLIGGALGENLLLRGDPNFGLRSQVWAAEMTKGELHNAAQEWLNNGYHEQRKEALREAPTSVEADTLTEMPPVLPTEAKPFPEPERFTLSNGTEVVFVQRTNSPTVEMAFVTPVGRSHHNMRDARTARHVAEMISSGGAGGLSRQETEERSALNGARIYALVERMQTRVGLSTNVEDFEKAISLWALALRQPNFSQADYDFFAERNTEENLVQSRTPEGVAFDQAGVGLFGADHYETLQDKIAYFESANPDELRDYHARFFRPGNARIFAVGNVTKAALEATLEQELGSWRGAVPELAPIREDVPGNPERPRFVLVNKEGSSQTLVYATRLFPLEYDDNYTEELANQVFGGGFTSRLNLNIREDKGWTYGISSGIVLRPHISQWRVSGTITGEHTMGALREIVREVDEYLGERPIDAAELAETNEPIMRGISNSMGNNAFLLGKYTTNELFNKPHAYLNEEVNRLASVTVDEIQAVAPTIMATDDLTWVLVGDLDNFEDELRASGLGDVEVYDLSGDRIR